MEVGLAVGGAFLSSALNVLFDRLAPQSDLLNMFQKRKNDVRILKKLRMTLLGLQAVLTDAEIKQASNQSVSQWLNELRDAVDSAENLIEEVNYEALRINVEGQHRNLAETTTNQQVSDDFFLNIKDKLEDTIETLKDLQEQIGGLGLKEHFVSTKQETRTPSTSLVDDSDIFGRQKEIKELIDRLLSEDENGKNLVVVPIVGMGGVGKTTLAKVVYNNEKVKKHFGLKAWYCVSEAYDACRITKGLLQEIGLFDSKDANNLNQLQVKLKKSLKEKKFLVVLDDVWNDNYSEWHDLRNLFVLGDMGSKIIVTTRKESVAQMMCAEMMGRWAISVGTLSSDDSWTLFKRHSLENRNTEEHQELEEVGKQIAGKCKGLPLALKALAGVLRGKSKVEEWRNILRSEIWDKHLNGILPALMLSYNDLPRDLKQCFAFCAIYPKDYQFYKDQVIYQWIANGLIQQFHSGNEYFLELISRSLFERVPESGLKLERFLMHDLVNDLAQIASSNLCITLEENKGSRMLEQCRHMSYSMGEGSDVEKLKPLYKLEQLRTLLHTCIDLNCYYSLSKRVMHNLLPRLRSLRVLSLSHYRIKEVPDNLFIKLKLLRFLDLSGAQIKKLPDSICVLYNLEILLLSSCADLEELPRQMERLISLHHLDISNTPRLKMPLHLSKLKSLQVLVGAKFLVGDSRMEDLGEVQNLYGSLSVLELQNMVDRKEAVKANIREKNHVDKLSLEWSESIADNSQTERGILDELRPHKNIKELQITGYRGTKFSNWVADPLFLKNCVQLCIVNCKNCDSLPALGQLPSLKFLSIIGMHGIREVTEEFYGSSSSKKPFNSLEKIEFEDMPEWKQWDALNFPKLENLSIENCAKLMGKLPENLGSLKELKISRCPELSLETTIQLSSLKRCEVIGCPKVFDEAQLFTCQLEGMKQIDSCKNLGILPSTLETIRISGCQKLKLEGPVGGMFVEEFRISECDCIDDISPELLPRARILCVERCPNLTRFSIPTATETLYIFGCENVEKLCGNLPSAMTYLCIHDCSNLKWLPERMQELLPSLKKLILYDCPEIESFPEGGLPFNLQVLKIWNCTKLVNRRKEWCLQRQPCLRELWIGHDGSDDDIQHWELPSSVQELIISNLKTLSGQLLKSLSSLEYLRITGNLPHIQSLLEEGQLPSSLSELAIISFPNLKSLSESALPSSLSHLIIWDCPNLQSLSESTLPSSLSHLTIWNCPDLQSLNASTLPSSLSHLTICNFPNLQSLPINGMPSFLSTLVISNCPLLTPQLEFDEGEY